MIINMIDEIALRVAEKMPSGFIWREGCMYESGVTESEAINFAHALLAELNWNSAVELRTGTELFTRPAMPDQSEIEQPPLLAAFKAGAVWAWNSTGLNEGLTVSDDEAAQAIRSGKWREFL